jgi:phosphoglycolate phosphatase-like HAD superfamily hydrolase
VIKLVIFDWNGVLIADARACMDADNKILAAFGGTPVTKKQHEDTYIVPSVEFYARHGCDRRRLMREAKKRRKFFLSVYEPRIANVRTRRNTRKLLSWISKQGIQALILSNHNTESIERHLERLRIRHHFSEVVANTEKSVAWKRKGERLTEVLKKVPCAPEEILIVGDSPEETEIGKSAGIKTVATAGGYFATWRLKAAKPDHLISDVGQLVGIIKKS